MPLIPYSADKLAEAVGSVISEPFLISQRQDAIIVSGESSIGAFGYQLGEALVTCMGVD
ncbi:hypothetical protein D9M68_492400 [compost metagenome]